MVICELCGAETEETHKIKLEGSILVVCPRCVSYGEEIGHTAPPVVKKVEDEEGVKTIIYTPPVVRKTVTPHYQKALEDDEFVLVDDYAQRIRRKRQQLGLKQDELARKLNERESVVKHLETGKLNPDKSLIRKLENTLKIELQEPLE